MGKVEVWCEWCRKPVLVAEAHIAELETSLIIANTTAANLHDVIRDKDKRIAELEKELYEWVGWAQTMLKVVKGNKIVHGSLGGELECAITSRIAELEKEVELWKSTAGMEAGELQAFLKRSEELAERIAKLEAELAAAVEVGKASTKCLHEEEQDNSRLRACLKRLEWCDDRWVDNPGDQPLCPACAEPKIRGHASDCWLAKELKEGK